MQDHNLKLVTSLSDIVGSAVKAEETINKKLDELIVKHSHYADNDLSQAMLTPAPKEKVQTETTEEGIIILFLNCLYTLLKNIHNGYILF